MGESRPQCGSTRLSLGARHSLCLWELTRNPCPSENLGELPPAASSHIAFSRRRASNHAALLPSLLSSVKGRNKSPWGKCCWEGNGRSCSELGSHSELNRGGHQRLQTPVPTRGTPPPPTR